MVVFEIFEMNFEIINFFIKCKIKKKNQLTKSGISTQGDKIMHTPMKVRIKAMPYLRRVKYLVEIFGGILTSGFSLVGFLRFWGGF